MDREPDRHDQLEHKLGAAIRESFGDDAKKLERVGALVEQRAAILDRWQSTWAIALGGLEKDGGVRPSERWGPWGVHMKAEATTALAKALEGKEGGPNELAKLLGIEDQLRALHPEALVGALVARFLVVSTERHELQHLLDSTREERVPSAGAICLRIKGGCRELAAYLAQLADGPAEVARIDLASLLTFVLDPDFGGTAEFYAAATILAGLSPDIVADVDTGEIYPGAAADAVLRLSARSPGELREAARKLWGHLFRGPLPAIERLSSRRAAQVPRR